MTPRGANGGFILVAVLAIMALLAGLVASVSLVTRAGIGTVRVEIDDLAGDALLRAGLEVAAYQLVTLGERPDSIDGQLIRLDDGSVTLFVAPAGGRFDLNASPAPMLAAIYKASGLKRMTPETFADRVVDWRDPDVEPGKLGAEADAYAQAGLAFRPADDSFRTVDDLQWVLGVTPSDVRVLSKYFTVYNPKGTVNLFDAPREVLDILPGLRRQQIDRIVRLRAKRTDAVAAQLLAQAQPAQSMVNADLRGDRMVRVRLEARPNRGAPRTVEAVLIPDPIGRQPFRVTGWDENPGATVR